MGQVPQRFSSSPVRGPVGRPSVLTTFRPVEGTESRWLLITEHICSVLSPWGTRRDLNLPHT